MSSKSKKPGSRPDGRIRLILHGFERPIIVVIDPKRNGVAFVDTGTKIQKDIPLAGMLAMAYDTLLKQERLEQSMKVKAKEDSDAPQEAQTEEAAVGVPDVQAVEGERGEAGGPSEVLRPEEVAGSGQPSAGG